MFVAWGTSQEFTKNFTTIEDNIGDSLVVVKVVFLKRIYSETNGNKVTWKVLKGIFILATWEHCTLEKSEFLWHRNFEEFLYRWQTSWNDFRGKELPTWEKKTFSPSSTYRLNVLLLQLHSLCHFGERLFNDFPLITLISITYECHVISPGLARLRPCQLETKHSFWKLNLYLLIMNKGGSLWASSLGLRLGLAPRQVMF